MNKFTIEQFSSDKSDYDSDSDESKSDKDQEGEDEYEHSNNNYVEFAGNSPANDGINTTTANNSKTKGQYINRHMKYLLTNPQNKSTEEWYNIMKDLRTTAMSFASTISHPQKILENRFDGLLLDDRPVKEIPYPADEDLKH